MMMPANFTAVNSEVVYGGADLFSILADTAAPIWNAANVKTFNTNLLTILSNSFTKPLVNATMGTMFSGTWGDDDSANKKVLFGDDGTVSALYMSSRLKRRKTMSSTIQWKSQFRRLLLCISSLKRSWLFP